MDIKIKELFDYIEGATCRFILNQAAGERMFQSLLIKEEVVSELIAALNADHVAGMQTMIEDRLFALLTIQAKEKFAHPHDTAIAVYMYVLINYGDSELTNYFIKKITSDESNQFWWARKVLNWRI